MKNNTVTKEVFENCHTLVETAGLSRTKTAGIIGISVSTVGRVISCKTYAEYIEAARNGYKPLIKTHRGVANSEEPKQIQQTVTIQATHYMMQELQKTNEYLRLISNKLAYIVEELTGGNKDDGQTV